MLGQLPGLVPVGELRGIWHAVTTDELCGCGTPFSECGFWTDVGALAFGGWDRIDCERMLALDARYARHRSIPRLLSAGRRRSRSPALTELTAVLERLYRAVSSVSGADVLIDSSKAPPYAMLLDKVAGIDLRLVHLVRDSRGVAYSWSRRVPRPEYVNHPTLQGTVMGRRGSFAAALEWDARNALLQYFGRSSGVRRIIVRYESIVRSPVGEVDRIRRHAWMGGAGDGRVTQPHPVAEGEYESLPHHTLGGNRVRFTRGAVRLRQDEDWRTAMGLGRRLMVTTLTAPYLIAYGYIPRNQRL